ncbi:exopolysaccharide Pel transporter PelG [Permianibacter aggregans]|uniref:Putative membrane protein n=1 Tax=Permianibacter aggregans TaxID=1510150 RepID=A0A4R6UWP6_9GAMM|nr:exopolysaccharide Pel transporter PelG [Permianibacter aggregans]QGX38632.1 histidine kinase [Permianibacter aggregans]TDQ50419.1 putative membrane protein [Permianibacter aggregans]
MAGIGFEIRKILERDSYWDVLKAYGYAGLVSGGPWVLSILGVMAIGVLAVVLGVAQTHVNAFQICVTYLMALSLIWTGGMQLMFTRFVADQAYAKAQADVLPNLMGVLLLTMAGGFLWSVPVVALMFSGSLLLRLLLIANFVVLSGLWLALIFLSGMKAYRRIVRTLATGYLLAILIALAFSRWQLEGLLTGVLIGHSYLLFAFLRHIIREYPGQTFLRFDFLERRKSFYSLFAVGTLYYLGVWVDKFIFWFVPYTSEPVIGPLRASIIYDLPIFLAYLFILPGMAVFLVRMEADFAEQYERFYRAVREGDTLMHIEYRRDQMVYTARQGIYEIFKVQGLTVVLCLLWGRDLLAAVGISPLYIYLFYIDVVAVSVQVLLMAILNVLFYLDARREVLVITLSFFLSNLVLTSATLFLGAETFGYGFAVSVTFSAFLGLFMLSQKFNRLEYETFMLQQ